VKSIKATILTAEGERVCLRITCPTRAHADTLLAKLYPWPLYSSVLVFDMVGGAS
jgi:hypothetical protein